MGEEKSGIGKEERNIRKDRGGEEREVRERREMDEKRKWED